MSEPIIGVTAASFLKNEKLCDELLARAPKASVRFAAPDDVRDEAALARFLKDAPVWIVGREPVSESVLNQLRSLKLVAKYGVGLDNIDLEACRRRGIAVASLPGVNAVQVAELTLGLMLSCLRNIARASRLLREGQWEKVGGVDLHGRTVGIIGCGHIGTRVMGLVRAFGCPVVICDIEDKRATASLYGAHQVSLEELAREADVVTVHVPLTPATAGLCDRRFFQQMKKGSVFINTARGEVMVESALHQALTSGHLRAAACDVFLVEPAIGNHLIQLENFIGTPHIGGASEEAMLGMGRAAIDAVTRFFNLRH